jgi:hypothetical protein
MIKVAWTKYPEGSNTNFWVKETNPYFNWYKENRFYNVVKEATFEIKTRPKKNRVK